MSNQEEQPKLPELSFDVKPPTIDFLINNPGGDVGLTQDEKDSKIQQLELMVSIFQPALEYYAVVDKLRERGQYVVEPETQIAKDALIDGLSMGFSTMLMKVRNEVQNDWREALVEQFPELKDQEFRGPKATAAWLKHKSSQSIDK